MKKLFLTLGILSFVWGGYYLQENYTFVQLSSEQLAQVGSTTLESSVLGTTSGDHKSHADVLLRIGSFAIVKNSSEMLTPEQK